MSSVIADAAAAHFARAKQAGLVEDASSAVGNAWKDFQAWQGWNQLRDGAGHWGGVALDWAKRNPELTGAALGALLGGIGYPLAGSIGSATSGVPQTTPFAHRALLGAALGGTTGALGGWAAREFTRPAPSAVV